VRVVIAGLIPAAGHSRRMGRSKLALPVAGRTVLEHVVFALRQAGVVPVLVVLGPHVADLAGPAQAAHAEVLLLPEATADMRATVEHGLARLEERYHPGPGDAWMLVPADHPTLDAGPVSQLVAAWRASPGRSIVVPTWQGRRGHPTLVAWNHVAGIRAHPPGAGLNTYFRLHAEQTLELPVDSAAVVEDLDTPEDYERLLSELGGAGL
jgi:molybdenum cofactor cytidylyltransferase